MLNNIKKCPGCGNDLVVTKLSCKKCNIEIAGEFQQTIFSELTNEERFFVEQFLLSEGNFSKLQSIIGETYLSVKEKLQAILVKLGLKSENNEISKGVIEMNMIESEDSKIVKRLKERLIASDGKSYMPMLKGEDIAIWLAADGTGIIAAGLKSVTLKWSHFDAIIAKANALGGKMYRGDSAAQNGARIGSDDLPMDTIDAFISMNYFGANIGDTILRRSTYYAGVLAWADIATNHRSDGSGGYISVRPEFRN